MAVDLRGSAAYRRIAGLYAALLADQQAAVVKPDLRLVNWDLNDADEVAADRAAIEAEAKANPRRSTLLDKLTIGSPVIVECTMLRGRLPADAPPWMREGHACVRVYGDDVVEPCDDGPADQRQY
jgi:hypothetical protein